MVVSRVMADGARPARLAARWSSLLGRIKAARRAASVRMSLRVKQDDGTIVDKRYRLLLLPPGCTLASLLLQQMPQVRVFL